VDFVVGGNVYRDSWYAPVQVRCQRPYLVAGGEWFEPFGGNTGWAEVQMSVPKVALGHSVAEYGDTRHAVELVLGEIAVLSGQVLQADEVLVRRADFCRTIKLPNQESAAGLIDELAKRCKYPNRDADHWGRETVMWAVREESFKAYVKLPELLKRRGRPPASELDRIAGFRMKGGMMTPTGLALNPIRAQKALKAAAAGQVRFEVSLRSKALIGRFADSGRKQGHRYGVLLPLFLEAVESNIGDEIMRAEYDKVLSFEEVSSSDDVGDRLAIIFGSAKANRLYRFWEILCEYGDKGAREHYSKATFYRYRSALKLARIGTLGNDVEIQSARRRRTRAEIADLLSHLEGYGEHLRACHGDEFVDELQKEAGLPVPRRRTA